MVSKWIRKQTKKYLKYAMKQHAKVAEDIDKYARELDMENDQDFLDWQDSINSTSVR